MPSIVIESRLNIKEAAEIMVKNKIPPLPISLDKKPLLGIVYVRSCKIPVFQC